MLLTRDTSEGGSEKTDAMRCQKLLIISVSLTVHSDGVHHLNA